MYKWLLVHPRRHRVYHFYIDGGIFPQTSYFLNGSQVVYADHRGVLRTVHEPLYHIQREVTDLLRFPRQMAMRCAAF